MLRRAQLFTACVSWPVLGSLLTICYSYAPEIYAQPMQNILFFEGGRYVICPLLFLHTPPASPRVQMSDMWQSLLLQNFSAVLEVFQACVPQARGKFQGSSRRSCMACCLAWASLPCTGQTLLGGGGGDGATENWRCCTCNSHLLRYWRGDGVPL